MSGPEIRICHSGMHQAALRDVERLRVALFFLAREAVWELYADSAVGCCLHVTLDDGNVEDDDVEFCFAQAIEQEHPKCEALARALLELSPDERWALTGLPGPRPA